MIVYVSYPKIVTRVLLLLIKTFTNVSGIKIS